MVPSFSNKDLGVLIYMKVCFSAVPSQNPRFSVIRSIVVFLFVSIAGPSLGALLFICFGVVVFEQRSLIEGVMYDLLPMAILGYKLAGMPALITSFLMAWRTALTEWVGFWLAGGFAIIASIVFAVAPIVVLPGSINEAPRLGLLDSKELHTEITVIMGILSIISALICQLLLAVSGVIKRPQPE